MSVRFLETTNGYMKGQVVHDLGGGLEDIYVVQRGIAVFVDADGVETDAAGKVSHPCQHCGGTGRAKALTGPPRNKMVKEAPATK